MKQAQKVTTRFPIESDLGVDNIRRLSDLINEVYKEFLKKWYSRMGYKPQATESLEILYPELVPELATECDFTVWYKSLA